MVLTVLTGGFGLASKREERKREMSRSMETMDAWGSGAELLSHAWGHGAALTPQTMARDVSPACKI